MVSNPESPADAMVDVAALDDLSADGHQRVTHDGQAIALFHHEGEVYAVDDRCPHMGFPLTEGTVEEGVLTCHWHHARFELSGGDTFDPWADDVQTFPVTVQNGRVYVDPDPEPNVPPDVHWRNRLADGLQENIQLVMAKGVIGLVDAGEPYTRPLETVVDFGTTYRDAGWGAGLTIATAMANVLDDLDPDDRKRALYTGAINVADDCAGEPPRFQQHGLAVRDVSANRLESWYRENVDLRDADAAERTLRTAIGSLSPPEVAEMTFAAATDHIYMDAGHALDHLNKAFEVLDHLGWEQAEQVLPACIENVTDAARGEEQSSWRQPIDLADLRFAFEDDLPELVATGSERSGEWDRPDGFVDDVLADDPHVVDETLREAVRAGATSEQLASAITTAAMRRVVQFSTGNEFSDWNTVHHTFTFANAVHGATRRTDTVELYRGVYDAAMSVYLDRFLNMPPAPDPDPGDSDADPAALREELLDTFDVEGAVNRATELVAHHFDAGGDPAALKRTLGAGLLREDANFHTLQSAEAGFTQFDRAESDADRRLALMAPARYMAAHFPTRRETEQTFTIASRLHRGEKIHEAE